MDVSAYIREALGDLINAMLANDRLERNRDLDGLHFTIGIGLAFQCPDLVDNIRDSERGHLSCHDACCDRLPWRWRSVKRSKEGG